MPRKQHKKYDHAELLVLQKRLSEHRRKLAVAIKASVEPDFDEAVTLRDNAQFLVTTCNVLQLFEQMLFLAEYRGPQIVPHVDECGLE